MREACSEKAEVTNNESDSDRKMAECSTRLEINCQDPDRDLKREVRSRNPEAMFQVAVSPVEQDLGLELQVSFPELTLATMLPKTIDIEAARALRIELFSTKLAAVLSEALRFLPMLLI